MEQYAVNQEVLRTDLSGMPLEWINYRDAARLYYTEQVAYTCGSPIYKIRGGYSALTGERSVIEVNSIIATLGDARTVERKRDRYTPPLNNRTLFRRDANLCLYCAMQFRSRNLLETTLHRSVLVVWMCGRMWLQRAGAAIIIRAVKPRSRQGCNW